MRFIENRVLQIQTIIIVLSSLSYVVTLVYHSYRSSYRCWSCGRMSNRTVAQVCLNTYQCNGEYLTTALYIIYYKPTATNIECHGPAVHEPLRQLWQFAQGHLIKTVNTIANTITITNSLSFFIKVKTHWRINTIFKSPFSLHTSIQHSNKQHSSNQLEQYIITLCYYIPHINHTQILRIYLHFNSQFNMSQHKGQGRFATKHNSKSPFHDVNCMQHINHQQHMHYTWHGLVHTL